MGMEVHSESSPLKDDYSHDFTIKNDFHTIKHFALKIDEKKNDTNNLYLPTSPLSNASCILNDEEQWSAIRSRSWSLDRSNLQCIRNSQLPQSRRLSNPIPDFFGSFVGSYEESILNGRMSTAPSKPVDFSAEIGVFAKGESNISLMCPPHIHIPFVAHYFDISGTDSPSPYVGNIPLSLGSHKLTGRYHIPRKGLIQVIIRNQKGAIIKLFLVQYDFEDMPSYSKTILRQKSRMKFSPFSLRYAIHLNVACSRSGKVYLYKSMRVVLYHRSMDLSDELSVETEYMASPKYIPIARKIQVAGLVGASLSEWKSEETMEPLSDSVSKIIFSENDDICEDM